MIKPMEVMMTIMLNVSMSENIDMIITIINSMQFFSLLAWLTTRGTSQNCEYRQHHQYHPISLLSKLVFIIIVMAPDEDHRIACFKTNMTENKEQQWATFPVRSKRSWCKGTCKKRFSGFFPLRGGGTPLSAKLF